MYFFLLWEQYLNYDLQIGRRIQASTALNFGQVGMLSLLLRPKQRCRLLSTDSYIQESANLLMSVMWCHFGNFLWREGHREVQIAMALSGISFRKT